MSEVQMMLSMEMDAFTARMALPQLFEATFDLVSSALVLFDSQGQILKVNGAFAELLGYSLPELLSIPFPELLYCADRESLQAVHGQAFPVYLVDRSIELRYRRRDGSLLNGRSKLAAVGALLLGEIVPFEAPQPLDKRLEQDQWLQRIVETAPGIIGILRLDNDGKVSMPWASPGYEEYYGVTGDQMKQDASILFERIHSEDVARVQKSIAESARSLCPWQCEYRVNHPLKGEIWLEGRSKPTLEADGAVLWFGFLHDISERKRIEQALLESEERFRLAFESVAIGMALLALDGRWLRVNPYLCELLGRSEVELLQTFSQALTHPDDLSWELACSEHLVTGNAPYLRLEKRYLHHNGQYLRVQLTASAIRSRDGTPLYFVVQIEDLNRLLEAEERLSLKDFALCHVHEAAYLLDEQTRFRYVNDEACRSLSYSREELLRIMVADLDLDWTDKLIFVNGHNNPERYPEIIESRHRARDGRILPVEISITYIEPGGQHYKLALARDIVEHRRLQTTRQENENRYREVFDNSLDCLYLLEVTEDQQFRYIEINTAFERSSGLDRQQLIGRCVGEVVPEAGRRVMVGLKDCRACDEIIEWESELELPAGLIAIHATFIPVRDERGHIYRIVGISRDISERKRMEIRLLASEQQFRALAENSLNLIISYDQNCRRTYVNPAFERETCIPAVRALQLPLEDRWSANMPVTEYLALLRQVISTGEPLETVLEWPCSESGKNVVHAIQLIAERGVDGAVVSVLAKGHNITTLKRHERLEEARLCIFERLARGAPLPDVLALVTKYIELTRPEFLASIMLVDDDGCYLIPGSVSRLPPDYPQTLGHIKICEGIDICGTAAWCGTTVIAEDLATHPYCDAFSELAIKAGLRACWSEPIKDSVGKVLGTFCIHLRQPGLPTEDDLELMHQASHLAAIAIERKRADTLLLESEQRYREIFDNSLDSLILVEVTEEGHFCTIEVNPAAERDVGMSRVELIGRNIKEVLPSHLATITIAHYQRCMESGAPLDEEVELDLPAGRRIFHWTLIPVRGATGRVQRIAGIARDITERKHTERVLHAREQEFRALVENTPDVIARFDTQCRFLYANPAAQSMLDRPLAYLLGKTSREASPHSNAARSFQGKLEKIVRIGKATEEEVTLDAPVAQNAEAACYQVRLVPEHDQHGGLVSILAVGRNVSAMRAAERRLKESHAQLRQLSIHRETTREEERKRIAREIHDELGQQLTALRMGISLLRLQFGHDHPLLLERVQALMVRVDETIQVVRNVATSLRPSALDMGLISALEWLVSAFSQNTGIHCQLRAPSARLDLDDERATATFRVVQESLTNVARHAKASRVDIHLDRGAGHVLIEVRDNGEGFDPEQLPKGTLGMLGMRERGHMLGGVVTIDSARGQGVRVRMHIPIQVDSEAP
ncbi:PAS domain S-box protein [Pseudomonas neuropathica]